MKFKFIFAWYDIWVGAFYDRAKNWLYLFPVPMFGFIVKLPQIRYWLTSNKTGDVIGSTDADGLEYAMTQDDVHGVKYWAVNGETRPVFGRDHCDDTFFGIDKHEPSPW